MNSEIQELLVQSARRNAERQAEVLREEHLKVFGALYDRAIAYTRAVVTLVYATAFGVWAFLGDAWDTPLQSVTGLLLLFSATVFGVWQVGSTIRGAFHLREYAGLIKSPSDNAAKDLADYAKARNDEAAKISALWAITVAVTLLTGLAALGIMVWAIVQDLIPGLAA